MWWGERDPGSRVTEQDRLIVRALAEHEADLCDCGHPRSESMDPGHDPADPESASVYAAGQPFRCHACTERDRAQRAYAEQAGEDGLHTLHGLKWVTELVPRRVPRSAAGE